VPSSWQHHPSLATPWTAGRPEEMASLPGLRSSPWLAGERTAGDAQPCGDGRHRAGGVLCCPLPVRRCVTAGHWGVSDPAFSPANFAPRDGTESLTPQPSIRCLPSALSVSGAIVGAPAVSCRLCDRLAMSSGKTRSCRSGRSRVVSGARACVRPSREESLELCSAACKARRFASTTRVVRAWPSGLDAACAQLAGRQLRDGLLVRLERNPDDTRVRKSPAGGHRLSISSGHVSNSATTERRVGGGQRGTTPSRRLARVGASG
jgi:hypothetical protein